MNYEICNYGIKKYPFWNFRGYFKGLKNCILRQIHLKKQFIRNKNCVQYFPWPQHRHQRPHLRDHFIPISTSLWPFHPSEQNIITKTELLMRCAHYYENSIIKALKMKWSRDALTGNFLISRPCTFRWIVITRFKRTFTYFWSIIVYTKYESVKI